MRGFHIPAVVAGRLRLIGGESVAVDEAVCDHLLDIGGGAASNRSPADHPFAALEAAGLMGKHQVAKRGFVEFAFGLETSELGLGGVIALAHRLVLEDLFGERGGR